MQIRKLKVTLCGLVACGLAAAVFAATPESNEPSRQSFQPSLSSGEVRAKSLPSKEVEYAFAMPGLIGEVEVKDGDVIKVGQVLAKQDTAVEDAALAREEYEFNSTVQKRAAVAQRDLSAVEVKRQENMLANKATSPTEFERAKVELLINELKIELAEEDKLKKGLDIAKLKKQIERMSMVSKHDGIVRKVEATPGEVSDPQKPSIVVVVTDPLKIEVKLPALMSSGLKIGQTMQVRYLEQDGKWRDAKVTYFDPVADATTSTQTVHLEMPNPEGRRAGQWMAAKLPEGVAAAK